MQSTEPLHPGALALRFGIFLPMRSRRNHCNLSQRLPLSILKAGRNGWMTGALQEREHKRVQGIPPGHTPVGSVTPAKEAKMKRNGFMAAMAGLIILSGCGPLVSLQPAWDEAHLVSVPGLAGTWKADEDNDLITVEETGNKTYRLTYLSREGVSRYEIHAVQLQNHLFLDAGPDSKQMEGCLKGEVYQPWVPGHIFLRAGLGDGSLSLALLDEEVVERKVKNGELALPLQVSGGNLVLTARTAEVQAMLLRFAEDSDFWNDVATFRRISE
jgi:hypothetical protein